MLNVVDLRSWFAARLVGLPDASEEATAYVVSVISTRNWSSADLSTESIVMAYQQALAAADFSSFQRIGDWVLFVESVHPQHVVQDKSIVERLAHDSYLRCYRSVYGQWPVYRELALGLSHIARRTHERLLSTSL